WVPAKYLSGLPSNAFVRATAIDSTDTVLIAGSTGNTDAFLARYSLDGLHQLSYLLLHNTNVSAITSDSSGNSYLTGGTTANDFPTTTGAWQRTPGPRGAAFILKPARTGDTVYSTLLGGPASPYPQAIAVNRAGEAFVTGSNGGNLPITEGGLAPQTKTN